MIKEVYQKVYLRDDEGRYGFQINNDYHCHGYTGDVKLPGIKPLKCYYGDDVDEIIAATRFDHDCDRARLESGNAMAEYIKFGFKQLLLEKKSDWKITNIDFDQSELILTLKKSEVQPSI